LNPGISNFYYKLTENKKAMYPIEAYNFVLDTIVYVSRAETFGRENLNKEHHLSPAKICSLLNSRMKREFGIYVNLVLETWKVNSSSDVGKIVFTLAEYKCLKLTGSESLEDFEKAGLGDFK